jgi:hypothetical protein
MVMVLLGAVPISGITPNLNLNGLNHYPGFFEEGKEEFEREIKLLQQPEQKSSPEELLQLNMRNINEQKNQVWCIDSNNNLMIKDLTNNINILPEENDLTIPRCYQN